MDDLVVRTDIEGGELVKEIRKRLGPGASLDAILDTTREVNMKRYALCLGMMEFPSVLEMVEYVHANWDLNIDDTKVVLKFLLEIHPSEQLEAVLKADLVNSVWKFTRPEEPKGCFSILGGLGRSRRQRRTSPRFHFPFRSTNTQGTGR